MSPSRVPGAAGIGGSVPGSPPSSGPRSAALDAVRVIGVAAVIVGHAIPDDDLRRYLFSWHVPVFFFLSGYLWRTDRTLRSELGARTRSLAYPYLFWLAVIGAGYLPLALSGWFGSVPSGPEWLDPLIGGATAHEPFTTFWFVSVLFFVSVLYRLVSAGPAWLPWVVAIAGLGAGYVAGPFLAHTPLAIGSAFPCLIFVLIGRAARGPIERMPRPDASRAALIGTALIGAALIGAGELTVGTGLVQPVDIKPGRFGTPVAAALVACIISVGLVIVARCLYARASARVAAVTTTLAYAGLTAVLLHPLVQWMLRPLGLPHPIILVAMLVVPWGVGLALHRSPLSRLATGVPRAARVGSRVH